MMGKLTAPLNLPAPGRRQTLYIDFMSLQSPVFLVNSRLTLFSATSSCFRCKTLHTNEAPLIPKLRGQFAEFLNERSLVRLRILILPTCVGLRYGYYFFSGSRVFLAAWIQLVGLLQRARFPAFLSVDKSTDLPADSTLNCGLAQLQRPVNLSFCVTPPSKRIVVAAGILTC